ncbi:hypothetical protein Tco_1318797 [Tanacetum coccineum]
MFIPTNLTVPKLQTAEDLQGDALLHYDTEMKLMNLILLSIPNDIIILMDALHFNLKDRGKRVNQFEKLVNVSRAKKPTSVLIHEDGVPAGWMFTAVNTNSEDLWHLQCCYCSSITKNFNSNNKSLHTSSNTRNQAIIQGDRVNIQSRNSGNTGRNNRRAYVLEEIVEGSNAPNETGNVQRTLSNLDEAGVILTDEQNDFLFVDASRMEEIKELSANIYFMARI